MRSDSPPAMSHSRSTPHNQKSPSHACISPPRMPHKESCSHPRCSRTANIPDRKCSRLWRRFPSMSSSVLDTTCPRAWACACVFSCERASKHVKKTRKSISAHLAACAAWQRPASVSRGPLFSREFAAGAHCTRLEACRVLVRAHHTRHARDVCVRDDSYICVPNVAKAVAEARALVFFVCFVSVSLRERERERGSLICSPSCHLFVSHLPS